MGVFETVDSILSLIFYKKICIPLIKSIFDDLIGENPKNNFIIYICKRQNFINYGEITSSNSKNVKIQLFIHNPIRLWLRLAMNPKLGLTEGYMYSEWDSHPSPKDFFSFLICAKKQKGKNKKKSKGIFHFFIQFFGKIFNQLNNFRHFFSKNSLSGSRRNIKEHYDLGNEMFALFLDESMTYSCAIFNEFPKRHLTYNDTDLLKMAQFNKYDIVLNELELKKSDKILEIGCGWGAFGLRAVQKSHCNWTGLTISNEQFQMAKNLAEKNNLGEKIHIKFLDYREEFGKYNHIVAIEMIEAVGHEYLPKFFKLTKNCLKTNGKLILQAIICRDEEYENYRKSSDFIKKHIFPGGHMPSLKAIENALPKGMEIKKILLIGKNYSPTLDIWCSCWMKNRQKILSMGYSEIFFRKWEIYFSLCSALFLHGNIDTAQIVIQKIL